MTKLTEKKKENWVNRLDNIKFNVNRLFSEISECGVDERQIDTLANLTCWFDEAMAEIEELEVRP